MKTNTFDKNLLLSQRSGPFSVAFNVTSKCNMRCRHCYNNSGDKLYNDLSDTELIEVSKQIADISPVSVCLCGGEPLIRGDIIFKIIEILTKGCGAVNIVSNGTTINTDSIKKLKSLGVNTIQISLDGNTQFLHDNLRMVDGAFDIAVNAIRLASSHGFRVAVSCCPNKLNLDSIEKTCELVKQLGANELRFMPLILMGRGAKMKMLQPTADQYLRLQQKILKLNSCYKEFGFSVTWGDPLDHIFRMPINSINNMSTYSMEIRSDGKLMLSTYLPIVVGDLRKNSLKEYWDNGYNNIWGYDVINDKIKGLYSTDHFNQFSPKPYNGEDLEIDLLKLKKV